MPLLCFYHILTSSAGDLLLNRPTSTWNLFVKSVAGKGNACLIVWPMGGRYHGQLKNPPVQVPVKSQDLPRISLRPEFEDNFLHILVAGWYRFASAFQRFVLEHKEPCNDKVPSYSIHTSLPVLKNDKSINQSS